MSRKTLICLHTALVMGVSDVFLIPEDKSKDLVESNLSSVRDLAVKEPKKYEFFARSLSGATVSIIGSIEDGIVLPLSEPGILVKFDDIFAQVNNELSYHGDNV